MRRFLHSAVFAWLFAWICTVPAVAVQPDEVLRDPGLEARARALSAELRCLVCQNQSIDDSDAPLARDLRILLRERLKAGDTDAEAVNFLVERYGEFVLLKPRFAPHTIILWLGPFIVLGLAVLFAVRRRRLASGPAPAEQPLTQDEARRLAELAPSSQRSSGPMDEAKLTKSSSGRKDTVSRAILFFIMAIQ